jgi:hypothetical protein
MSLFRRAAARQPRAQYQRPRAPEESASRAAGITTDDDRQERGSVVLDDENELASIRRFHGIIRGKCRRSAATVTPPAG